MSAADPELRQVHRSLASARDTQIAKVVAIVDRLADRGEADALIAPLRGRLVQLRPPRPLRMSRVLYMPLDPLIVPAQLWRRGMLTFPRCLLPSLTARIEREGGNTRPDLEGLTSADSIGLLEIGRTLWPQIAELLTRLEFSSKEIAESGVPAADHGTLVRQLAAMLALATDVQSLWMSAKGAPPTLARLRPILEAAIARDVFGLMTALLLARFPHAKSLLGTAQSVAGRDPNARAAVEQALDATVNTLHREADAAETSAPELNQMSPNIGRLVALLDDLEQPGASVRPDRQVKLAALRRRFDTLCKQRFEAAIANELLGGAKAISAADNDEEVTALEGVARDLRRFETAARGLGDPAAYAKLLTAAVAQLGNDETTPGLKLSDRVRLVEILAGPEEALALFAAIMA